MTILMVAWFRGVPAHEGPNWTHPFLAPLAVQLKAAPLAFSAADFRSRELY